MKTSEGWTPILSKTLPYVMDRVGEDVLLFASDYPHWDGNFPYVVSTLRDRKDISDETKVKILHKNPIRLYGRGS